MIQGICLCRGSGIVMAYPKDYKGGIPWAFKCSPCSQRFRYSDLIPSWGGEKARGYILADERDRSMSNLYAPAATEIISNAKDPVPVPPEKFDHAKAAANDTDDDDEEIPF